jgi:phage-related protein
MIIFDGIDLATIANVKIEDIRPSKIADTVVSRPRAIKAGSVFVRNRYASRTVAVTFAVLTQNLQLRQAEIMAISEWAKSDKEYKLELPGYPDHYLMAVCTDKPEPSFRQWWESKLRLVFTCVENPFWNSRIEKSVACGTSFKVLGDAPPLMRIERSLSSAASNQSYGLNGNTMTFSTIPAGNMIIDLNDQTARVGNTNIMQYYNPTSRFLIPTTGTQTITGTGTVKYRERWQ